MHLLQTLVVTHCVGVWELKRTNALSTIDYLYIYMTFI